MNKSELIDAVAKDAGISKKIASDVITSVLDNITKSLKKGKAVRLVGFGTFDVIRRKATKGRNPRTGQEIQIPASRQPKFKAGKALKAAIN